MKRNEKVFSVPRSTYVTKFWVGKGAVSGLFYVMCGESVVSEHKTEDAAFDAREVADLDYLESQKFWM